MSWVVELPPQAPMSVLADVADVQRRWPGGDALELRIGERRLVVPLRECDESRAAVAELARGAREAAEIIRGGSDG